MVTHFWISFIQILLTKLCLFVHQGYFWPRPDERKLSSFQQEALTGLHCSFPILSSLLLNDILCVKVYLNVAMLCMCLGKGNVGEVVVSFVA